MVCRLWFMAGGQRAVGNSIRLLLCHSLVRSVILFGFLQASEVLKTSEVCWVCGLFPLRIPSRGLG